MPKKTPERKAASVLSAPTPIGHRRGIVAPTPETTSQQLAFDLFSTLAPYDKSITESEQEIGFRKNNLFLEITGLGLAARRALDVVYFIVAQPNDENELYESHAYRYSVDQSFFKWLMGTSSRNWRHLRGGLREAQKAAIEITIGGEDSAADDPLLLATSEVLQEQEKRQVSSRGERRSHDVRWGSVQLIGTVSIQGGRVAFEIHPVLAKHIKNPQNFHFLSLRHVFKSLYAKTLYDQLIPYIGQGTTPWIPVDELRAALGAEAKTYDQYKFLRQFVLAPAITEINTLTELQVEAETRNVAGSRKVGHLRFKIIQHENAAMRASNQELKELFLVLRNEFGLSTKSIDEILSNRQTWTNEHLNDAIEYTRFMIKKGKVKLSPSGYLMKAIKEGYKLASAQLEIEAIQEKQRLERHSPPDPYAKEGELAATALSAKEYQTMKEQSIEGIKLYDTLEAQEQDDLAHKFLSSAMARVAAMPEKIPKNEWSESLKQPGAMRDAFGRFVFQKHQKNNGLNCQQERSVPLSVLSA